MIDKKKIKAEMMKIMEDSDWKLGKNNIPIAYQQKVSESIDRIQRKLLERALQDEKLLNSLDFMPFIFYILI